MKIYILNWDYDHSEDEERDAFHLPFMHSDRASSMFLNAKYKDKYPPQIFILKLILIF